MDKEISFKSVILWLSVVIDQYTVYIVVMPHRLYIAYIDKFIYHWEITISGYTYIWLYLCINCSETLALG